MLPPSPNNPKYLRKVEVTRAARQWVTSMQTSRCLPKDCVPFSDGSHQGHNTHRRLSTGIKTLGPICAPPSDRDTGSVPPRVCGQKTVCVDTGAERSFDFTKEKGKNTLFTSMHSIQKLNFLAGLAKRSFGKCSQHRRP